MASKSKKRRRVFRASCILAALIIAGSSFAWFTSKDEVTNRLTANSDYGVSIVESFVPPENWLPGQTVNKDVYAVNTGNIAAFVKETVSGELNYDYEIMVEEFDPETCVQITGTEARVIDGATKEEAGGYLVWSKDAAGNEILAPGPVNSARNDDVADEDNDPGVADPKWTPPASGDYIFRRSVINTETTAGNDPTWTYTYAGYHFEKGNDLEEDDPDYVPDRYYKIVIGNDAFRAATETHGNPNEIEFDNSVAGTGTYGLGVAVDADGIPQADPTIHYVELREVKSVKPKLTFHGATDDDPAYLQVSYTDKQEDTAVSDALKDAYDDAKDAYDAAVAAAATDDATVAQKEVVYRNEQYEYNTKKSRYDQTKADSDYANALYEAVEALYTAADTRKQFELDKTNANQEQEDAEDAVNSAAQDLLDDYEDTIFKLDEQNTATPAVDVNAISYQALIVDTGIEAAINGNTTHLPEAKSNMDALKAKWEDIKTTVGSIRTKLTSLATDTDLTIEEAEALLADLNTENTGLLDVLQKQLKDYKNLYANLVSAPDVEETLTLLNITNATTNPTAIQAAIDNAKSLDDDVNAEDGLKDKVEDYRTEWDEYDTLDDQTAAQDAAWNAAIETYNKAVDNNDAVTTPAVSARPEGATKTYNKAIGQTQELRNSFEELTSDNKLTSHAADGTGYDNVAYTGLANTYSVGTNKASGDPTIDTSVPANVDYNLYTGTPTQVGGVDTTAVHKTHAQPAEDFAQVVGSPTSGTFQTLSALKTQMDNAQTDMNTAYGEYDQAMTDRTGRQQIIADAEQAMDDAEAAYEAAIAGSSQIDIRINLADTYADLGWTFDDTNGNIVTEAEFYLNKILEAGETSTKLIDSVYLADTTTTADYKNLQFDLNVGLDSIQVTYDANQRDYTADAVNADPGFTLDATVDTTDNSVTWG